MQIRWYWRLQFVSVYDVHDYLESVAISFLFVFVFCMQLYMPA